MDLQSIIVTAITVIVGILYYVVTTQNKKKRDAILLQPLHELAQQGNYKISTHNLWNKSAIGMDEEKQFVFFTRQTPNATVALQINIFEFKHCRVNTADRAVARGKETMKVIDRIELLLQPKEGSKNDTVLEFYNSDYDSLTIQHELEIAEKWSTIINNLILTSSK